MLGQLLSGAQTILGDHFVGLYLYGSLAGGDFDPKRSDIDFVVVTNEALPDGIISALEEMHMRLAVSGSKWAAKLEGTYIPRHALRRYDPNADPCPCLNEGKFYLARHGSDWVIQRHILREGGVVVAGPTLRDWIDPVTPNDIRRAVAGILREWWSPMLGGSPGESPMRHEPAFLQTTEYQAYAVLTMCRAIYTLNYGAVVSKPAAARWAQATLGERWAALIDWALKWSHDEQSDKLAATLDFIRYTLENYPNFQFGFTSISSESR